MKEKIDEKGMDMLYHAVLSLQTTEECRRFFKDLCTMSELRAMSQRLEVASMLSDKRVYTDIAAKTGASTATISRVNHCLNYGTGGYHTALQRIGEKQS